MNTTPHGQPEQTTADLRPLSTDEIDGTAGALHIHIKGIFHLAIGPGGDSIGVGGYGVGVSQGEGAFTFTFD
jgi:hypothetical protein